MANPTGRTWRFGEPHTLSDPNAPHIVYRDRGQEERTAGSRWESPRRLDQPMDWSLEKAGREAFDDVLGMINRYPFMPLLVGLVAGFLTGECLASCMSSRD